MDKWAYIIVSVIIVPALIIAVVIGFRKPTDKEVIEYQVYKNPIVTSQYLGTVNYAAISKFEPTPGKICYLATYSSGVSIWCEPDKK